MTENIEIQNKGPTLGVRHVQTLLLFLCFVVNIIDRLKISVAVFAMTEGASSNSSFQAFDWDKTEKGYIIAGMYWGTLLTQFAGSVMCRWLGAKNTILISTLGSAITSLLTPSLIPLGGWQMYTCIAIVQGMFQGLFTPCIHDQIAKWAPFEERTRLGAFSYSGIEMGTILAMGVPGLIAESSWGWPGISYVAAGISIAWCVLWMIFADNSPTTSRFIGSDEKEFILASHLKNDGQNKKIPIPWKAICTSVPFMSLIGIECAQALGFKTMQNEIPSYLHGILKMDIKSNSFFSALAFSSRFIMTNVCIVFGDVVIKKNIMSLKTLRRTVSTISTWFPAACLCLIGFLDEHQKTLAIVLMTSTVGINGGKTIGSALNPIDLSSNHAATLTGIVRTASSVVFMLTPMFVATIVSVGTDRSEWQKVFAITALVLFFGNLQYIILGRTDSQPWNDEHFGQTILESKIDQNLGSENTQEQALSGSATEKGQQNDGYLNTEYEYPVTSLTQDSKDDYVLKVIK
ncbi:putative inorganic phosphate cotransporter [Eupeodes corollae]|uniref:putative inorganic phosphate cotransporter n=1 Tax=Eupeodes corollae TaxID=290404 RepID=UPI002492D8F1|nr:putative inorganic phosphate cotransporter [Eupeodes corollae]